MCFLRVPVDVERRLQWSLALGIQFPQTGFVHVCSDHFSESNFTVGEIVMKSGETVSRRRLSATAIPKVQEGAVEER